MLFSLSKSNLDVYKNPKSFYCSFLILDLKAMQVQQKPEG
jgi:hypothetical protein